MDPSPGEIGAVGQRGAVVLTEDVFEDVDAQRARLVPGVVANVGRPIPAVLVIMIVMVVMVVVVVHVPTSVSVVVKSPHRNPQHLVDAQPALRPNLHLMDFMSRGEHLHDGPRDRTVALPATRGHDPAALILRRGQAQTADPRRGRPIDRRVRQAGP